MDTAQIETIKSDLELILELMVRDDYKNIHPLEKAICQSAFDRASLAVSIWASVLAGDYDPGDAEIDVQTLELSDGLREACMAYWEANQPDYSMDDVYVGEDDEH